MSDQPVPGMDRGAAIASQFGLQRSPEWNKVRMAHLSRITDQQYCAVCQGTTQLEVHHIIPFHLCHLVYRGDLELDERNLMTLCEVSQNNHHLLLGHLNNWEIYNPAGREGIITSFRGMLPEDLTAEKIRLNQVWKQWMDDQSKPVVWQAMKPQDRIQLRQLLDRELPYQQTDDSSDPQSPYPFEEADAVLEKGNQEYIATTYGSESRWKLFLKQNQIA